MKNGRSLPLKNAPLQYAPHGEMGVVYLFANIAKKLQFRIEEIRAAYPDCIAYRQVGDHEKMVKIEFEYRSSNFKAHRHNPKLCDCIVCWHHDWHDAPRRIEIIELKKFFGVPFKVWIQGAVKSEQHWLDEEDRTNWVLSSRVTDGDLLLMYRASPVCSITDIFRFCGTGKVYKGGWRKGKFFSGVSSASVSWTHRYSWKRCETTGFCVHHPSSEPICGAVADCWYQSIGRISTLCSMRAIQNIGGH